MLAINVLYIFNLVIVCGSPNVSRWNVTFKHNNKDNPLRWRLRTAKLWSLLHLFFYRKMGNLYHNPSKKWTDMLENYRLIGIEQNLQWTSFVNWCTELMCNEICLTMIMQIKILHNHFFIMFYKMVSKIYFHKHFWCNLVNDKNTKLSLIFIL